MARAVLHAKIIAGQLGRETVCPLQPLAHMGIRCLRLVSVATALLAVACHLAPQVDNSRHAPAIERIVSSSPAWIDHDKLGSTLWRAERDFYESRSHLPAWMDGDKASPRLAAL